MIIIKLQGGVGNQLFQYAFGRFLETVYHKEVAYDDSFFTKAHRFTKREYALKFFNVHVRLATEKEVLSVKYPFGVWSRGVYFLKKLLNKFIFKKYAFGEDEKTISRIQKKDSLYIEGWWQTYSYTTSIIDTLRSELTLRTQPSEEYGHFFEKISQTPSVSVHIRRGDYVGSRGIQVMEKEYYEKAANYIKSKVPFPIFFLFSDDIQWSKDHMRELFPDAVFIEGKGLTSYEELMLMSACTHSIIANSTFSWWGAMLSRAGEKIVIAPYDWKNKEHDASKLCPPEWVLV